MVCGPAGRLVLNNPPIKMAGKLVGFDAKISGQISGPISGRLSGHTIEISGRTL